MPVQMPMLTLVDQSTGTNNQVLVIGCEGCPARASAACEDCLVTVMFNGPAAVRGSGRRG